MKKKVEFVGLISLFFSSVSFAAFIFLLTAVAQSSAVTLLEPADNSTSYMIHPHFKWTEDVSADRYEIQIATDSSFAFIQQSDSIPVPRYVPKDWLTANDDYWWRVRAQYADGSTGGWSGSRKLSVVSAPYYRIYPTNTLSQITNTIAAAAANTPSKIFFEVGTYSLNLPDGMHLLDFKNLRDLYIEGNHCQINLQNPNSGFSYFDSCEDVLLRRFKVDYVTNGIPVTHTAGTVVSTDSSNGSFVFEPLAGYLPPTDPRIRDASSRRWGCLMDTNTPGRLKVNVNNWFDCKTQVDDLGGNQYRIYLIDSHIGRIRDFEAGDTFVKSASYARYIMYSAKSTNITYELITSYAGSGNHFIGHWNDGIHFLRCKSLLKPGRFQSNPCGGYVGSGYLTGFWIEECLTEGLFDDGVNCNNRPVQIYEKLATNTFSAVQRYPAPLMEVGQHLTLFNPSSGQLGGIFEITDLEWVPASGRWTVTVDGDLGEVFPGSNHWDSQLFIQERSHQYAYVRNSTFRNSRRIGTIFKAHSGVIEGNTYTGLSETAIRAENDCISYDEGFDAVNVRILNNTISECGTSSLHLGQRRAAIELISQAYNTDFKDILHRNIEISGNQIFDWTGKGIHIRDAGEVLIHSNVIANLNSTAFLTGGTHYSVYVEDSQNLLLTHNDLLDDRPVTASLWISNCTDSVLLKNLLLNDTVYSNSFSGSAGGNPETAAEVDPGLFSSAYLTELDGAGSLIANTVNSSASLRVRLDSTDLAESTTAIRVSATVKTPTNDWVGIGFMESDGGGAGFLRSGANSGPWLQINAGGSVILRGGHSTLGSADIFSGVHTSGAETEVEMIYYPATGTVDLNMNGVSVAAGKEITHVLEGTAVEANPVIQWVQIQLRNQAAEGASVKNLSVDCPLIEVH